MGDEIRHLKEMIECIDQKHDALMERLIDAMSRRKDNSSQSNITLNAGGIGVWIAVTACAAMLAINMALIVILVNHDRKIDDLSHYLNAIYMAAPHLKP